MTESGWQQASMRKTRIYTSQLLQNQTRLALDEEAARHVARVLRMNPGDRIVLFNGQGGEYDARLTQVDKHTVSVQLEGFNDRDIESGLDIELVQAISRGDRMDITIQKAVELGVGSIQPLFTSRCNVKLAGERLIKKHQHWHKIIISACEQCGRTSLPELHQPLDFQAWIAARKIADSGLILDPLTEQTCKALDPQDRISLLVGPEGGLSEQEIDDALAKGFTRVRLGPRVLRTETAALAIITAVQTLWGDFS